MANKNGHWYTDKNGNHYFVEEGQTPQEGWEASKRRKMINGGKYQVSEDGNEYRDVEKDEYDKFEADDASFDDNIDDDFGFDEEDEDNFGAPYHFEDKDFTKNDHDQIARYAKRYEVNEDELYDEIIGRAQDKIREGSSPTNAKNDAMEEVLDEVANGEYNREMQKAQEQNAAMSEGQEENKKWHFEESGNGEEPDDFTLEEIQGFVDRNYEGDYSREDVGKFLKHCGLVDEDARAEVLDKLGYEDKPAGDDLRDPNNPKYKDFKSSDITNAELVDEGEEVDDFDKGGKRKLSIIKYTPYGALKDGRNDELYGVVDDYDGSDTFKGGAIVSHSLESAKEDLKHQIQLAIQGSDRYLKRGKYDEDYFNIVRDNREPGDDEKYKERYGWDFNKPFAEHDFMKDDPYNKYLESKKPKPAKTNGYYSDNPIGKMAMKGNPDLTGERILHEGFKRAIPPEKISNALVKALGVSKEDADKYVKENTISANDPGWMDLDEWLKNGGK